MDAEIIRQTALLSMTIMVARWADMKLRIMGFMDRLHRASAIQMSEEVVEAVVLGICHNVVIFCSDLHLVNFPSIGCNRSYNNFFLCMRRKPPKDVYLSNRLRKGTYMRNQDTVAGIQFEQIMFS